MTSTFVRPTTRCLGVAGLVVTAALLSACGSSSTTLSAPAGSATSKSTARLPAGTATNSKFCQIAKAEQDQSTELSGQLSSGSPTQLKAFIDKAVAELPAFAAAAPDSIKSDVQKLVDIDNKLYSALKSNNYDFTKSEAAVQAAVSDPGFATAGGHVTSYLMTGCGLSASLPTAIATP